MLLCAILVLGWNAGRCLADDDEVDIEAEEADLNAQSEALSNEVNELDNESTEMDEGGGNAPPAEETEAQEDFLTKLVTCQQMLESNIQGAAQFKTESETCSANLASSELQLIQEQSVGQTEETERHKAKLEEKEALDKMHQANDLRTKETELKETEEASCDKRKTQLNEAHALALQNVEQTEKLVDAQVSGAAAAATSHATDMKLQAIQQIQKETQDALASIRVATASAVKIAQEEAAEKVVHTQSELNRTLTLLHGQMELDVQAVENEAAIAVNKTHMEQAEAVRNAASEQQTAAEKVPVAETQLATANQAAESAQSARDAVVTKKSQYKAWVETQLAAALSSVQRSTNAARMATMMITQATAVLAAP